MPYLKKSLLEALYFANGFVTPEQMDIILCCRRSILFHNGEAWIKKIKKDGFDVSQGLFDGTRVSELISLHIFYEINRIVHINNHGLYRDDRLMTAPDNRKTNDNIRKVLFKLLKSLVFETEVDMKKKIDKYLNVELNLQTGSVSSCMKPNTKLKYGNVRSNPTSIIKQISKRIESRLSRNSFSKIIFEDKR